MKKVWKYVLSIMLVIILAGGGTIYYFLNVKTYDIADEEIKEIIESDYDIVLPGEVEDAVNDSNSNGGNGESNSSDTASSNKTHTPDQSITDKSGSTNNENSTGTDENNSNSTGKNNSNSTGKNNPKNNDQTNSDKNNGSVSGTTPEVTVAFIKDRYRPVFHSLQSQANGKIEALLSRAMGEYRAKQSSGESISYSYFYQKYTSAGRDLETKTDTTFNYIFDALENDLKKHGFSPSHANDFKTEYASAKKERESSLLKKAKEAL